jgi:Methyltransferase domain
MRATTRTLARALGRRGPAADWLRRRWKGHAHPMFLRELMAERFLRGRGIEIGALHLPLRLPEAARARYVDRFDRKGLLEHYPDLAGERLAEVDVIDDGERLVTFAEGSVDFVVANHFLEHAQDVFGVLARFCEVVRVGGAVYLCVPDKEGTFDRDRPLTPIDHLYRDYAEGPGWSYLDHVREFVRLVQKFPETGVQAQVENIVGSGYSIHFHVWTHDTFSEMLLEARRRLRLPFVVRALVKNEPLSESVCVLQRCAGTVPQRGIAAAA